MPAIASLECSRCHHHISADTPQTLCPLCAGSLYVRYDMDELRRTAKREDIIPRAAASPASLGMWRYSSVLPDVTPVTLGPARRVVPQHRDESTSHHHDQGNL